MKNETVKPMNVIFLMFAFPDMEKSYNMYTALVEEFHRNGHKVFVVAPENNQEETEIRIEKGISILRVKTFPLKNVHNYIKGIANLFLPYQYARAIRKYFKNEKFDLIITPTPPITLSDLAAKIKRKSNSRFYLILRDIFPQNAIDLGFIGKGSLLNKYFRKKEIKLYQVADYIGCMSKANINYIINHNTTVAPGKLHILQNYQIKNEDYLNKDYSMKKSLGLENKFIVVFGGNMGKPQQLENVLALAMACESLEDVVFLLLGEGVQKQQIERSIVQKEIRNIIIRDSIPKADYQNLIKICDVGLISLHKDFTIPNIPSKALDYFNMAVPILASIDRATDFGEMLDEADAGLWSYAGDLEAFKANFLALYNDAAKRKEMGLNGRKYFEKYLTPDIAFKTIMEQINKTA